MENLATIRNNVIEQQVRPWGGLNYKANHALVGVPRELFVPDEYKEFAFSDMAIPLNDKYKMFSPKFEGRLLDAVAINDNENVLEIGTGSGYLTAVMSQLANSVTSIDIDKSFIDNAKKKFETMLIDNVNLLVEDASKTLSSDNFFDVVIVGCSVPKVTGRYFHLLKVGGRIFVVEGVGSVMSAKVITRKSSEEWETKTLFETQLEVMQGLELKENFKF
ncbi:Protein-L-isoaspartate O-methyltransferase [hydrothermal vent metagenome]|uniref:Protein-L-isoaspartate O-methyltransferase n=1 Tax=hydrothermal vent metagenome TaxID=652676 RepID=A0A1W1CKK1_9ZZZZ